MIPLDQLRSDARELARHVIELPHDLYRHLEIGLDLPLTQGRVVNELDGLPLEIALGQSCSSVPAVLPSHRATAEAPARPPVLLRGDIDALPVNEPACGRPCPSRNSPAPGRRASQHTIVLWGAKSPCSTASA